MLLTASYASAGIRTYFTYELSRKAKKSWNVSHFIVGTSAILYKYTDIRLRENKLARNTFNKLTFALHCNRFVKKVETATLIVGQHYKDI
jgi:hypothetical protein